MLHDQIDTSKQGTIIYGQRGSRLAITVVGAAVTEDDVRDYPQIPDFVSRSKLKLPDTSLDVLLQIPTSNPERVSLVLGGRVEDFAVASLPEERTRNVGNGFAVDELKGGDILIIQGQPDKPMYQVMIAALD